MEEKHIHLVSIVLGMGGKQYRTLLNKMSQLDERMVALSARSEEAKGEILALLEQMRADLETLRNESLTDTGRTALESVEGNVNALADVVQPAPEPEPEPEP